MRVESFLLPSSLKGFVPLGDVALDIFTDLRAMRVLEPNTLSVARTFKAAGVNYRLTVEVIQEDHP